MKLFKVLIISFLCWQFSDAQNENRSFEKAIFDGKSVLTVNVSDGTYFLKAYDTEIIETTFVPKGEKINNNSHAVVMESTFPKINFWENKQTVHFETEGISATVTLYPFQISYSYKGKYIISEKNGYQKVEASEAIDFNLETNEILYGGGARALGMNRRGNRLKLYNRAHYGYETRSELMNFTLPLYF